MGRPRATAATARPLSTPAGVDSRRLSCGQHPEPGKHHPQTPKRDRLTIGMMFEPPRSLPKRAGAVRIRAGSKSS
jgi:hypothetical protein